MLMPTKSVLRKWINVLAAIPAIFSLGLTILCTSALLMFWLAFHGWIFMLAGYIFLALVGSALVRGLLGVGSRVKDNRRSPAEDQRGLRVR